MEDELEEARENVGGYRACLREKQNLLDYMLSAFDDGKHDGFFCLAANMLDATGLNAAIAQAEGKFASNGAASMAEASVAQYASTVPVSKRAQVLADALKAQAEEQGIVLELRS